jgi:adenylosuccinate synthase
LPKNARLYLEKLCELIGAKLGLVGVGQKREQTIVTSGSAGSAGNAGSGREREAVD